MEANANHVLPDWKHKIQDGGHKPKIYILYLSFKHDIQAAI